MEKNKIKVTIYCLIDPFTLKVRYIGRTKNSLAERLYYHLGKARWYKKRNIKTTHVHNWLNKCIRNGKSPIIRKLCEVTGWKASHKIEKCLINRYKDRLVNLSDRGEGGLNKTITKAQKQKISETLKRKYANNEIEKTTKKVHVYTIKGDYIKSFNSITDCSAELKIDAGKISETARGKWKQLKGYRFSFKKLDRLPPLIDFHKGKRTSIKILDSLTEKILNFNSIAECNKILQLEMTTPSKRWLKYTLRKKHNNRYYLIVDNKIQKPKAINQKIIIKDVITGETIEFIGWKQLALFFNLSKAKGYSKYLINKVNKHPRYEFVELPLPDNPSLKTFYGKIT